MAMFKGTRVIDGQDEPSGYQQLTSLGSSTTLTVPDGTRYCVLSAETQALRFRDDGTAPTASVGMPLPVGAFFIYTGDPRNIKVIEQTASGKLNVLYYK